MPSAYGGTDIISCLPQVSISYGGSRISYCVAIYHFYKSSNSYAKTAKISFLSSLFIITSVKAVPDI